MSSTATPMWSIRPNTAASLCRGRQRVLLGPTALDPEDLRHRRQAGLELLGRWLLGRQVALDLPPGGVECLGHRVAVATVAPGGHLHLDRRPADRDPRAHPGA